MNKRTKINLTYAYTLMTNIANNKMKPAVSCSLFGNFFFFLSSLVVAIHFFYIFYVGLPMGIDTESICTQCMYISVLRSRTSIYKQAVSNITKIHCNYYQKKKLNQKWARTNRITNIYKSIRKKKNKNDNNNNNNNKIIGNYPPNLNIFFCFKYKFKCYATLITAEANGEWTQK